ncbi:MAG: spore coat protein U domain-containing protein [Nevskiales bacterium]|nr:spore coat protein U domain-containing protein [Nevskiales bacterium]
MNENGLRCHITPATSLLLSVCLLLNAAPAQSATTCTADMTDVQFGSSDPYAGWTDVNATLSYNCNTLGLSLLAGAAVRLCFSIGSGSQGTGSILPRRMLDGSNELQFNLFSDAARTQVWGTFPSGHVEVTLEYSVPVLGGSGSGTLQVYGRVESNQLSAIPGSYSYTNSFSGSDAQMTYRYNEQLLGIGNPSIPTNCTSSGIGGGSDDFPFTASATVNAACNPTFSVQNIDFGTQGLLTAAIDTTATLSPQCTNTTPYQVGLDNGLHASGNTRRMQSSGGQYVTYELYRDAGRSQRWGNTQNVDTLGGTGAGDAQNVTIYSRVASQNTPPSGDYSDTVTVTIYY